MTLMFGLAFSKAVIATCVCLPSVPRPDSANAIVCFAEAGTCLTEDPELDPPQPATAVSAAIANTPEAARLTDDLDPDI